MSTSIRFTQEDFDNISKISLARGGISLTEVVRVVLSEAANEEPVLAIVPAMAPVKDVKSFNKAVQHFSDDLQFVVETGLPDPTSDATPADRQMIKDARARFISTYAGAEEIRIKLELLLRLWRQWIAYTKRTECTWKRPRICRKPKLDENVPGIGRQQYSHSLSGSRLPGLNPDPIRTRPQRSRLQSISAA